jgi:cytochrome c oxidase subunit 2
MNRADRRRAFLGAATSVMAMGLAGGFAVAQSPRVIKVRARRFEYNPKVIEIKKGESVILELTTDDVFMGFNVPDLHVRADIVPGKTSELRISPQQQGRIDFVCDIFCGDKHEEMQGYLMVT